MLAAKARWAVLASGAGQRAEVAVWSVAVAHAFTSAVVIGRACVAVEGGFAALAARGVAELLEATVELAVLAFGLIAGAKLGIASIAGVAVGVFCTALCTSTVIAVAFH